MAGGRPPLRPSRSPVGCYPRRRTAGGIAIAGWSEGRQFGRFTLRRELGAGAFAEVWLATETSQLGFRKDVALKLLRTAEPAKIQALQQEARLVASLHHPNIVDILAVEDVEGTWTVVMEYVDGGTLEGLIGRVARSGLRLPVSVVLDLGLDIARALDRAHTATDADGNPACILHRDLKPANILVDRAGVAKLTDFGVAKVVGAAAATATGAAKGTPAYIAPESWAGDRDFRPTVDLFGLGCILYELFTLQRLFEAESVATIFWLMLNRSPSDEVAPLREELPELAPIVERLLARDPAARYQAASEVERDLAGLREATGPTGDLGQFLKLLEQAERSGEGSVSAPAPRLPETADVAWRELLARASGEGGPRPAMPGGEGGQPPGSPADIPAHEAATADLGVGPAPRASGSATEQGSASPARHSSGAATGHGAEVDKPRQAPQSQGAKTGGRSSGENRRPAPQRPGTRALSTPGSGRRAEGAATRTQVGTLDRRGEERQGFRVPRGLLLAIWLATGVVGLALVGLVLWRSLPSGSTGGPGAANGEQPPSLPGDVRPADLATLPVGETGEQPAEPSRKPGAAGASSRPPVASPADPGLAEARATAAEAGSPTPDPRDAAGEPAGATTPGSAEVPPGAAAEPDARSPTPAAVALSAQTPTEACLVTTSTPGKARVWIDGAAQGRRALSAGSRLGARTKPGWVTIGMGTDDRPTAWVDVELVLGRSSTVHCDLGTNSCTSLAGDFAPCTR